MYLQVTRRTLAEYGDVIEMIKIEEERSKYLELRSKALELRLKMLEEEINRLLELRTMHNIILGG